MTAGVLSIVPPARSELESEDRWHLRSVCPTGS
jgi:hypothetical protein